MTESPFKSLNNFFVVEKPEEKHNVCPVYFWHNLAMKSMENKGKSMRSISSEMVSNLLGKMPIIRREPGLFSKLTIPRPHIKKFMNG